jgi:hypothetical protein
MKSSGLELPVQKLLLLLLTFCCGWAIPLLRLEEPSTFSSTLVQTSAAPLPTEASRHRLGHPEGCWRFALSCLRGVERSYLHPIAPPSIDGKGQR